MKLTSVELHPADSSEKAVLSFRDPGAKNPYNVKGITGLDADALVPKFYRGTGTQNFYNLSLENRQIVIRVGLNPQFAEYQSYSDLRDALYRMIASSRTGKLQLQFKDRDHVEAYISGTVSKLEAPLFEKTQEIQITLTCDDPMLRSPEAVLIQPLAEAISSQTLIVEDKKSTAPHGFSFDIKFTAHVGAFQIEPEDGSWNYILQPLGGFEEDDVLMFSSDWNNKSVIIKRGFSYIPIADGIYPGSVWPILFPGRNKFEVNTANIEWQQIWFYPTYWGV